MDDSPYSDAEPSGPNLAFLLLSGITTLILAALIVVVALPALGQGNKRAASLSQPVRPALETRIPRYAFSSQRTVVYLVSSTDEAARLEGALSEWRQEIEALGIEASLPRRVVVVQTPDDVLHRRIIDFTLLATQGSAPDLDVIDLRD